MKGDSLLAEPLSADEIAKDPIFGVETTENTEPTEG